MAEATLKKLTIPTLETLLEKNRRTVPDSGAKKANYVNLVLGEIDEIGVKQLTYNLNQKDLMEICEFLEVDHGANNPRNKMVLSKRVRESMIDTGVTRWLDQAPESVLKSMGKAIGLTSQAMGKLGPRPLRATIREEIESIGLGAVLENADFATLKIAAEQLKVKNFEEATTKGKLVDAICYGTEIALPQQRPKKSNRKPKLAPIEECTTYDQIFQHYKLSELEDWARENGVKTSGPKKALINRILAFLEGDTENTMASTQTGAGRPKTAPKEKKEKPAAKPKAAPKKAKKPEPEPEPEPEESEHESEQESEREESEQESEEVEDMEVVAPEPAKKSSKKVSKKAPEPEPEPEESEAPEESQVEESAQESIDIEMSDAPSLKGMKFAISGKTFRSSKKAMQEAILSAGGEIMDRVAKGLDVLIVADLDNIGRFEAAAKKCNFQIVGEEYLKEYL